MNLVGTAGREDQGARRRVKRRERKARGQMGTVGKKQRGEREWGGGRGRKGGGRGRGGGWREEEEADEEEGSEAVAAGDRCLGGGGPRQT